MRTPTPRTSTMQPCRVRLSANSFSRMMVAELTNFMVTRLVRKTQTPASSASSTISWGGSWSREKTMPGTSHRNMRWMRDLRMPSGSF